MQVLTKSYFNNNQTYKSQNKINFGQIKPEHLFINSYGYEKNYYWAGEMIKCINVVKGQIKRGCSFRDAFDIIRLKCRELYSQSEPDKFRQYLRFGVYRKRSDGFYSTERFQFRGKFGAYRQRFLDLFAKLPNERTYDFDHFVETRTAKVKQHVEGLKDPVELSSMEVSDAKPIVDEDTGRYENLVALYSAPIDSIKPVFGRVGKLYDSVVKVGNVKHQYELDVVNKRIAEMHWFLAQLMPCQRGSAGITDVFTKSLYESLGVQVHPWKTGVAPDLEAFVRPLDDYVGNYPKFFEKPPEIM